MWVAFGRAADAQGGCEEKRGYDAGEVSAGTGRARELNPPTISGPLKHSGPCVHRAPPLGRQPTPALSLCLWTIPTCRVRGLMGHGAIQRRIKY